MLNVTSGLAGALAAVCVIGMVSPAAAQETKHGCVCIHNKTKSNATYRYQWGESQWRNAKLEPGYQGWICWTYENQQKSSPALTFQIDADVSGREAWTSYVLPRVQSETAHCNSVGKEGHYDIIYRPNSNDALLQVTKRSNPAASLGEKSVAASAQSSPSPAFESDRSGKTSAIKLALADGPELRPRDVFERVSESIFVVRTQEAQGSAVAISERELLTNCHVLKTRSTATLERDGQKSSARLISADPGHDRCILQSERPLKRWVRVRPFADIKVGEPAFSIGAPKGLELTIAEGIVSSKRTRDGERMVQTSAPISHGSSGGGLFDAHGNLLGITTWMRKDAQNLNFAIAAEEFAK